MTDKAVCVGGKNNHKDLPAGAVVGTTDEQTLENKTVKGAALGTKTISAEGPTDNVDVAGVDVLFVDTGSNNVTIGGFVNGKAGQVLQVVITDATNNTVLENQEATGNQDMYLNGGSDLTFTAVYGGVTLVCDGSNFYEVSSKAVT